MTKRNNKGSWILIPVFSIIVFSCSSDLVFTDNYTIRESTWGLNDVPEFEVPVTDTITANNIMIMLRTGSDYPFRNLYLFVTATSPKGESVTDTLQYYLADEKGNRYGKGFGDIHAHSLPYKSDIYFPSTGTYTFKIRHGMRAEDLKGVYDVGLRIEKIRIKKR